MTFHVRLVSPPDDTERLVGLLAGDPGISNLVVLPGTARRPDGDAVQFDVRSESANSLFRELEAFPIDHGGAVAVKQVDATLGAEATRAPEHFLVQRDAAPVWEIVEAKIHAPLEGSRENATPAPDASPPLPNTMAWTVTAVPLR